MMSWLRLSGDRGMCHDTAFGDHCLKRRNFKIVNVIESEVKTTNNQYVAYSLALDESTDRNDKAHLAIFIRGVNEHFTVSECLLDVITKYNWRRSFPGTERHHRTEEVEFTMACVNSNRRGSNFIRDEVTEEWRKLHNAELHALYSSPDIIRNIKSRRLRWAGHVARMGESRNAYRVLVGRPEGKRLLGRPRRRWEDKMDLREVGYDDRDWINLTQDRDRWRAYVRAAMNLRVP
ncbi:hypothetical protein ANN_10454 [Periplaneta americana]|uniref:MULE transposase domain-containing protein n=1 Tax=Periplaneta americana TaxID=6978 RepID=A0ABQ8TP18_PERAM|nr:hypothetical protein ANN_10454 [Periplaneta americana]